MIKYPTKDVLVYFYNPSSIADMEFLELYEEIAKESADKNPKLKFAKVDMS